MMLVSSGDSVLLDTLAVMADKKWTANPALDPSKLVANLSSKTLSQQEETILTSSL